VDVTPIIPRLLLHRPLVWEQGLRAPRAASASVGWFPRSSQTTQSKTYCVLNALTGSEVLLVKQIPHTIAGFRQLDQACISLGVERQEVILGLETAHNLLVDYLWDQGYEQIYVLPPAAVKSAQKRHHQSGAKDDRWDGT